ncbi:MAG TPA: formimidoylglutamate deiminase [Burkholderiaceae bacterium]|nr:formimidoylglutamate deiminase [Burkholderiaceae bacterium]
MAELPLTGSKQMGNEAPHEPPELLWAPRAWIGGKWQDAVLLRVGADGNWAEIQIGADAAPQAVVLGGPALPGLVNAHSHCFQRAFAAMAERRGLEEDDFWTWRERMYQVALRIDPQQQRAIAAQLFLEMVRGGYTQVCEFHYLHNDTDGRDYTEDRVRMARGIVEAAHEVGIGLTLLPALYERAGFSQPSLREDQRRFRADADAVVAMRDALRASPLYDAQAAAKPSPLNVGLAVHSLRTATPAGLNRLLAQGDDAPIHIHVAEQFQEVDDCLSATGLRPIEWLCRHTALDRRWQLVHATHSSPGEIEAIARSGAGVVLCPSTEANLADGVTDLTGWLKQGVPLSVGSDSQVTRSAMEELRLLEYAQRLTKRVRCVAAAPQQQQPSTAERLWSRALEGGAQAAGFARWGLQVGARADLLVVDTNTPALLGVPASYTLDALVFSSPIRPFRDTLVAGRWVTRNHHCSAADRIGARFVDAMQQIWQGKVD